MKNLFIAITFLGFLALSNESFAQSVGAETGAERAVERAAERASERAAERSSSRETVDRPSRERPDGGRNNKETNRELENIATDIGQSTIGYALSKVVCKRVPTKKGKEICTYGVTTLVTLSDDIYQWNKKENQRQRVSRLNYLRRQREIEKGRPTVTKDMSPRDRTNTTKEKNWELNWKH